VALPEPVPGLVIGYAYLWRDEAPRGQDKGLKDRPCVIVLAVQAVVCDAWTQRKFNQIVGI
jgi:hypothetical protein